VLPQYDLEGKSLDPEVLRKCIFGGHVTEYMERSLETEGDERLAIRECFRLATLILFAQIQETIHDLPC
jgi:hypothetical protein